MVKRITEGILKKPIGRNFYNLNEVQFMPKQDGYEMTGTYDGIIFYKWQGGYYLRTKGNTGKQGAAVKAQSRILGRASNLSARLRKAVTPLSATNCNREQINQLNNRFQQWLRSFGAEEAQLTACIIPQLIGFVFTGKDLDHYFSEPFSITRNGDGLQLQVPALRSGKQGVAMVVPANILLVSCNLKDKNITTIYETQAEPEAGKPQVVNLLLQQAASEIHIAVIALQTGDTAIVAAWAGAL